MKINVYVITTTLTALLLASIGVASTSIAAQTPSVGSPTENGRIFLFREHVEGVYYDDWTAIRLEKNTTGEAKVHIEGQGKTANFDGILSINCDNPSGFFWVTGSNFYNSVTEAEYSEVVPQEVVVRSRRLFCRR